MNRLSKIVLATGIAFGAMSAHAATTVIDWSYSVSSIFTAAVGATLAPGALSWGTGPSGPSSLVISDSPRVGIIDTFVGGGAVPIAFAELGNTLTHNNNPINGTTLTSATIKSTLTLDAITPPGAAGTPGALPPIDLDIGFSETPNSGTCAVPTSPTPCNDIFVLTSGLLNTSFDYDVDGTGLQTYFVNIFPVTGGVLGVLNDAACFAAGQGANCIGFTTPEGASTALTFGFTVSTERLAIPEPGSLALAGIALLGAGLVRRRSRKAVA